MREKEERRLKPPHCEDHRQEEEIALRGIVLCLWFGKRANITNEEEPVQDLQ